VAFLIRIFRNRAGVDNEDVRGLCKIDLLIALLLKHPRNGGGFGVIELAAQGIKSDFFHVEAAKISGAPGLAKA